MRSAAPSASQPAPSAGAAPARRWRNGPALLLPSIRRRLLVVGEGGGGRHRRLNLGFLAFARLVVAADTHLEIGRGHRARRALALTLALRIHDAEIMLGVLIEVFRRDPVAAGLCLPRPRHHALQYLLSASA